jgi:hypothetical protein
MMSNFDEGGVMLPEICWSLMVNVDLMKDMANCV